MPPSMEKVGIVQADHQVVDIKDLPVLRSRVSPIDRSMTPAEAQAYQKGELAAPPQAPLGVVGNVVDLPLPPPPSTFSSPSAPSAAPPIPVAAPEIKPTDADSVRKRIGRLVGKIHNWEERALSAEQRLAEFSRVQTPAAPPPPLPFTNQYAQYPPSRPSYPGAPSEDQAAAAPISRAELMDLLNGQTKFLLDQQRLRSEQVQVQREAEMEFPEVFRDQEARQAFQDLMASDPYLQTDPRGPAKAAAIVRGMMGPFSPSGGQPPAAEARKAALSGVGPSIPSGNPTSNEPSLEEQYQAAMAQAVRTGRMEDYSVANEIRHRFLARRAISPQP